jgi:hypothetical protein
MCVIVIESVCERTHIYFVTSYEVIYLFSVYTKFVQRLQPYVSTTGQGSLSKKLPHLLGEHCTEI